MRSIVRLSGCTPPRSPLRPGRVTSTVSPARRASSAASSSSALRADSAAPIASRARLIASPAALRWSPGSAPSAFSCAVMLPLLPSRATRNASSASGVDAAAMSASACADNDSMSLIYSPSGYLQSHCRSGVSRDRLRGEQHRGLRRSYGRLEKNNGEGLAPFPTSWRLAPPIQPCVWIGGLRRQSALGLFGQGRKTRRVVHGDVRQHLAVQGDAGLQQAVHETAVAQAVRTRGRIDAGDPQGAEMALLLLAADVGVLLRLGDRLLGDAEDL